MPYIALRMLIGDRAKFIGIIIGLSFASLLITQQASIFIGIMTRTFGFITDTSLPDIWVMDEKVQFIDDIKPMQDTILQRVRGVEGVAWAVPLYKGLLKARLSNGLFQQCNVIGLDDASLVGGPPVMVEGSLADLRQADAVIVDESGARTRLAKPVVDEQGIPIPGVPPRPLRIGDTLELNDHRAVVVGLCSVSRTFQSQPMIYTTYSRATTFAPRERKLLSFVLVKAAPGIDPQMLCAQIRDQSGQAAYTAWDFSMKTVRHFIKYTGIPVNFGIAVALGFFIGTVIAGQTFYNFTLDNLRHFGALKAMGAGNLRLLGMIVLQALTVGVIGYGIGVGLAAAFGYFMGAPRTELAFRLIWQTLAASGAAIAIICVLASLLSIVKVVRLEPAIVFKS